MDKVYISAYTDESFNELSHAWATKSGDGVEIKTDKPKYDRYNRPAPNMKEINRLAAESNAARETQRANLVTKYKAELKKNGQAIIKNRVSVMEDAYNSASKTIEAMNKLVRSSQGGTFRAASKEAQQGVVDKLGEYIKDLSLIKRPDYKIEQAYSNMESTLNDMLNEFKKKYDVKPSDDVTSYSLWSDDTQKVMQMKNNWVNNIKQAINNAKSVQVYSDAVSEQKAEKTSSRLANALGIRRT